MTFSTNKLIYFIHKYLSKLINDLDKVDKEKDVDVASRCNTLNGWMLRM